MSFREMKDYELGGLSDEMLIAYVAQARKAGAQAAAHLGLCPTSTCSSPSRFARTTYAWPTKSPSGF